MTARRPPLPALLLALALAAPLVAPGPARAQGIDLSQGGPVEITARDGIDWHQNEQVVIARGDAHAVRGNVTVVADELIAHYRKKSCGPEAAGAARAAAAPPPATTPPAPCPPAAAAASPAAPAPQQNGLDTGNNEIYRLEAIGHVHIYTPTDQAQADHAVYDIDQAVLVLTGHDLKLTTPQDTLTARDSMEYWSQKHMAVGRGDAVVVTNDGRRVSADVLVGYTDPTPAPGQAGATQVAARAPDKPAPGKPGADPLASSGKLKKVEAFGHVEVRTATEIVRGDRGVYVPETGIALIGGNVRITRGDNQLNGNEAEVNLKTGISRLLSTPGKRVEGLVMPNSANAPDHPPGNAPAASPPGASPGSGAPPAGGRRK